MWIPLVPWIHDPCETHLMAAVLPAILCFLFGTLMLIAAHDRRYTSVGREEIQIGACILLTGVLFLIFGLWLVIPMLVLYMGSILYMVGVSLWSLTGR